MDFGYRKARVGRALYFFFLTERGEGSGSSSGGSRSDGWLCGKGGESRTLKTYAPITYARHYRRSNYFFPPEKWVCVSVCVVSLGMISKSLDFLRGNKRRKVETVL